MLRLLLTLLVLCLSQIALAQIYRCVDADGTLIFSDRPCGAEAEVHQSGANLSVIPGSEDHEQRLADNRAFIEQQRLQRQAQRRQSELGAVEARAAGQTAFEQRPVVQWVPFWATHAAPPVRPRPPESRPERVEQAFSALSGRQIGSTRRESEQNRHF